MLNSAIAVLKCIYQTKLRLGVWQGIFDETLKTILKVKPNTETYSSFKQAAQLTTFGNVHKKIPL